MILFSQDKIKSLLTEPDDLKYLISLKRTKEQIRKGGIPAEFMIKDFTYLNELLGDSDFRIEYSRIQDISLLASMFNLY